MPFNPTEIAADEAVIAGATKGTDGPNANAGWFPGAPNDDYGRLMFPIYRDGPVGLETIGYTHEESDQDFIAAARTRWPLYVAEVKRLREIIREAHMIVGNMGCVDRQCAGESCHPCGAAAVLEKALPRPDRRPSKEKL